MDVSAEGYASFPTTRATLVERARGDTAKAKPALSELLQRYRPALCTHLVLKYRRTPDEAEDLVQGFITDQILIRDLISRVNLGKGRFRSYLRASLRNYIISKDRGSGPPVLAIGEQPEPAARDEFADTFDREWAFQVIHQAVDQMKLECEQTGRQELWFLFEGRILGPCLRGEQPLSYEQIVGKFCYQTYSQATKAMTNAKRLYIECLRSVIQEYVDDHEEVDGEMLDLRIILARSGG